MFSGRRVVYYGDGLGLLGWLVPLVLFAALVGVLIYVLTRLNTHHGPAPTGPVGPPFGPPGGRFGPDPAIEQVRFRYARGEMSREEYLRLVEDLGGGGVTGPYPPYGGPPPPPPPPPPGPGPAGPPTVPGWPPDATPTGPQPGPAGPQPG